MRTINIYFVAHLLGWIIHGLLIRDLAVLHCWSLLTEFVGKIKKKLI